MAYYVVLDWVGVDETDYAIVGPFRNEPDLDAWWNSFLAGEPGWDNYGWSHSRSIEGTVLGTVTSPMEMVNKYPRTPEQLAEVHAQAERLEGMGFKVPDWLRNLQVKIPRQSALHMAATEGLRAWAVNRLQEDLERPNYFAKFLKPD